MKIKVQTLATTIRDNEHLVHTHMVREMVTEYIVMYQVYKLRKGPKRGLGSRTWTDT